jgi:hypothetical protein
LAALKAQHSRQARALHHALVLAALKAQHSWQARTLLPLSRESFKLGQQLISLLVQYLILHKHRRSRAKRLHGHVHLLQLITCFVASGVEMGNLHVNEAATRHGVARSASAAEWTTVVSVVTAAAERNSSSEWKHGGEF